jgi:hypothetical protein
METKTETKETKNERNKENDKIASALRAGQSTTTEHPGLNTLFT